MGGKTLLKPNQPGPLILGLAIDPIYLDEAELETVIRRMREELLVAASPQSFTGRIHLPSGALESRPMMLTRRRPPIYHLAIAERHTIVEERP